MAKKRLPSPDLPEAFGYRLYLLAVDGRVIHRDMVSAEDDGTALKIASAIYDACDDGCAGLELWAGPYRLFPRTGAPAIDVGQVNAALQERALEHEERIQRSRSRLARSQKLLASIDRVRGGLNGQ